MDKPISVSLRELKKGIAECINHTGLPPVLVLPVIRDIYETTAQCARTQTLQEEEAYKKFLKTQEENENEN